MYFTYVLFSLKDRKFYIGFTNDLKERLGAHRQGKVNSTKMRLPVILIYYEACLNKIDALRREKYFKSGQGKKILRNRLKFYLKSLELK
jgi:putative endonuclease